ncbi:MAG TPA: 2OG-Fe(II) oxygenase [Urbifossiella sp.]|jgi:hypothetical protein|nr:2OG-Fe(II) oxygenase [Urbifossiella sp.]
MARALSDRLIGALKAVDRSGSFYTSGGGPAPLPGLEVTGLGPVGLPLMARQAEELKAHCRQAPYGKGEKTIVDASVRRVWQLEPDRFALTNPDWSQFLSDTVRTVQRELGLDGQKLECHLYNLLLYEPGSFFLPHRDGEKLDRMVATLVVVLPSRFEGGALAVRHEGREQVIDFSTPDHNPSHTHFAAFYADCEHEVRPLRVGHRLCLVYNLTLVGSKKAVSAPRTADRVEEVADILRNWTAPEPRKLAVLLEHQYTQDGLVWDALKGADRGRAGVLAEAAGRAGGSAYLALLTLWESSSVEETYAPRGRGFFHDKNVERYEIIDEIESTLTAEHWSAADGGRPAFGRMEILPDEVAPPKGLTKVRPEEDVSGYTGNEGLTLNRWYRHAAVVLWPGAHHFDVLCDCGLRSATAALNEWVDRWQEAGQPEAADLKAGCVAFAGTILGRWEVGVTIREPLTGSQLAASLVRLADAGLVGAFLTSVVARDPRVEPDVAIAEVCAEHGWPTFRNELGAVLEATKLDTLERNTRLLERVCSVGARPKRDRLDLCEWLAAKAVAALEAVDRENVSSTWGVREVKRSEVLAGLARSLIATGQFELLARVVAHALAAPKTYPLPAHVAALTGLGPWLNTHLKLPCEAVSRWLAACCAQLESLTASEPVAPTDLRREATPTCKCADCEELRRFLTDPVEQVHRFCARQDRREHLEHAIRGHTCDLDCVTDRRGSPQTLVCTKNTASYQAKRKTYHEDLAHLSALRSIRANLPV